MDKIYTYAMQVYAYCTDFIINLANISGTSYYSVNTFIFCFLWPLLTVMLVVAFGYYKVKVGIKKRDLRNTPNQ